MEAYICFESLFILIQDEELLLFHQTIIKKTTPEHLNR